MKKAKPPLASLSEEQRNARLKKTIMAGLGKAWMFWPPRAEVRRRCAVPGKPGWFKCEDPKCGRETEKIEIDHVVPCVKPTDGWVSWDHYINSRFVLADKLQGLCHESHLEKSRRENAVRREMKKCPTRAKSAGSSSS